MTDKQFMLRALEVSKQALPNCRPNPPVGCVLVKDGVIVSEGYTQRVGCNHAEVEALNNSPDNSNNFKDIVAYVTLEPCAFEGRTPSCAGMLSATDITRVVVAISDPDPRNSGKGIQILESAGIKVDLGCAASEVTAFIAEYLGHS